MIVAYLLSDCGIVDDGIIWMHIVGGDNGDASIRTKDTCVQRRTGCAVIRLPGSQNEKAGFVTERGSHSTRRLR